MTIGSLASLRQSCGYERRSVALRMRCLAEWRRAFELQPLAARRMHQRKPCGMQQEAWRTRVHFLAAIQRVTQNGMPDVRQMHAHSWAEIYFPEIGWVEFEPTASQPEIELPPSKAEITNTAPDETASRLLNRFRLEMLAYWVSPFAILFFALVLYFLWIEPWLYMRMPPATAVEKMYRQLYRLGRSLAGERTKAETAYEFMEKLNTQTNTIRERSRFTAYLFHIQRDVKSLTDVYQNSMFAPHIMSKNDVRTALNTWKQLRLRLLAARIHVSMQRIFSQTRPKLVLPWRGEQQLS